LSRSVPLLDFCEALKIWMGSEARDDDRLRRAAVALSREATSANLLPEELLVLIKEHGLGISRSATMDGGATSTPESMRYIKALDLLWTDFFAAGSATGKR
jgi:hypothetical protein